VGDRELVEILGGEPNWVARFEIVTVDFSGAEPTVASSGKTRRLPLNEIDARGHSL
jgi:hypothetical protein